MNPCVSSEHGGEESGGHHDRFSDVVEQRPHDEDRDRAHESTHHGSSRSERVSRFGHGLRSTHDGRLQYVAALALRRGPVIRASKRQRTPIARGAAARYR